MDLGTSFDAAIPVTQNVVQSQNVLAKISGAKRPNEVVIYGAHWDAYGEGKSDEQGRVYWGGANGDALGVAGLFEIARNFKAARAPDRTIAFAFWTAEERGLLGSEAYAANLLFPATKPWPISASTFCRRRAARGMSCSSAGDRAAWRMISPALRPTRAGS